MGRHNTEVDVTAADVGPTFSLERPGYGARSVSFARGRTHSNLDVKV
jgi:hypothetical protein